VDKEYFVMLSHPVMPTPLMWDEDVMYFSTGEEAAKEAEKNPLGNAFGYEVFKLGGGLDF
jgi:hypothetical protein